MNGSKEWRSTALCLSIFIAYSFLPPTKNKYWFSMIVSFDYSWTLLHCWSGHIKKESEYFVQELLNSANIRREFCLRWAHKEHTHTYHTSLPFISNITHISYTTCTHITHLSHTYKKHKTYISCHMLTHTPLISHTHTDHMAYISYTIHTHLHTYHI